MSVVEASAAVPAAGCPYHAAEVTPSGADDRLTIKPAERPRGPEFEIDADGTVRVRSFQIAREILRAGATRQAGFNAEVIDGLPKMTNMPVLFQEGQAHQKQRKETVRFFTPKTVSTKYRGLMVSLTEDLVGRLERDRRGDVAAMSLDLAVGVAGEVIGLTEHWRPGMAQRLSAFFDGAKAPSESKIVRFFTALGSHWKTILFFFMDVKPSTRSRQKAKAENREAPDDLLTHLVALGYSDREILTECITYAAAGMATTREFITAAVWHMLQRPALHRAYVASDEAERHRILAEILRLEPVVGHIFRRSTEAFEVTVGGASYAVPAGALIDLDIHAVNTDADAAGECPMSVAGARTMGSAKAPTDVMSFGDGRHRCPGLFLAIQESDVFLHRLMSLPGLTLVKPPTLSWNDMVQSYELRDCRVTLQAA